MKMLALFMGVIFTWSLALGSIFTIRNEEVIVGVFLLIAFATTVGYVVELIKSISAKAQE